MDPGTKYITAFQFCFPSKVKGLTKKPKLFLKFTYDLLNEHISV